MTDRDPFRLAASYVLAIAAIIIGVGVIAVGRRAVAELITQEDGARTRLASRVDASRGLEVSVVPRNDLGGAGPPGAVPEPLRGAARMFFNTSIAEIRFDTAQATARSDR